MSRRRSKGRRRLAWMTLAHQSLLLHPSAKKLSMGSSNGPAGRTCGFTLDIIVLMVERPARLTANYMTDSQDEPSEPDRGRTRRRTLPGCLCGIYTHPRRSLPDRT